MSIIMQLPKSDTDANGRISGDRLGIRLLGLSKETSLPAASNPADTTSAQKTDTYEKSSEQATSSNVYGNSVEQIKKQQVVAQMQSRETLVIAHEAAHKSVGGQFAGSVAYSYDQGPDGKRYITGGEVPIDMSPGATPQETVSKMSQVQRAALAPSDPSGQDIAVAAAASAQLTQAQQELLQDRSDPSADKSSPTSPATPRFDAYA